MLKVCQFVLLTFHFQEKGELSSVRPTLSDYGVISIVFFQRMPEFQSALIPGGENVFYTCYFKGNMIILLNLL